MPHVSGFLARLGPVCLSAIMLTLAACGGAQEAEESVEVSGSSNPSQRGLVEGRSAPGPDSARDAAQLAQGARLSRADLQAAELQAQALDQAKTRETGPTDPLSDLKPGQIAPKSAYLSGDVARKAAAVRIPAYRFYNGSTGAHFYTTSETERATVVSTLSPPFSFDGPAFSVASDHSAGLASVHRFYNTRTGVHFYTISEAERANVANNIPQYTYEGVSYFASPVAGAGLTPLYRFYVMSRGFHFYTASAAEKANIEATLGHLYTYEGIGYHVLDTGWADRARLPHTGITTSQCYQAGGNTLVACGGGSATTLNPQQDGHRAGIAPMSYSTEPSLFGPYPIIHCVRDNVTGLLWEGKTVAGERAGSNTYTNLGNNAVTDTSGYVAAVNASELCGYTDWRLPTRNELLTIVDHGRPTGVPINTTWFPNTALARHWSADIWSASSSSAWFVSWASGGGGSDFSSRASSTYAVRLVRGSAPVGPRFSYSTVPYGSDGVNNVVNDAWTGLQWRRCEQGRAWNGSTCTGATTAFTHEQALVHARQQTGWRLPQVKELTSLLDLSVSGSGASIAPAAFPGASNDYLWSSSPQVGNSNNAWVGDFYNGSIDDGVGRNEGSGVRLVRITP